MTKWLIRIFAPIVIAALVVVLVATMDAQMRHERLPQNPSLTPDVAVNLGVPACSIATVAGAWAFTTTDLMYNSDGTVGGTALGVFKIDSDGNLTGTYDSTFLGPGDNFYPATNYVGTVSVNRNCMGTLTFHDVDDPADVIVQSIVIARSGREILGMFQHPADALGTFRCERIIESHE
jgi:hypothetical protein